MTAESVESIRNRHMEDARGHCADCSLRWPCDWEVAAEEIEEADARIHDLEQAVAVLAEGIDLPLCGVEAIAEAIASQQPALCVALWDRAQDIRKLLADPAVRRVLGEEVVRDD